MRLGIFSDIHANLFALEAVICEMKKLGVEKFVCLGDLVGYGSRPNEVIQTVSDLAEICVLGNHDNVAIEREDDSHFNRFAKDAIQWTRKNLGDVERQYLENLPYIAEHQDSNFALYFVHATPKSPADWGYVSSLSESADSFEFFTQDLCFLGHSHCPIFVVQNEENSIRVLEDSSVKIREHDRMLINVGSVGQPRDRDSRASWCLLDTDLKEVSIERTEYDIKAAQNDMLQLGFSDFLVERLSKGR